MCGSEPVNLIVVVYMRYITGLEIMSLAGKCVAKLVLIGKTFTVITTLTDGEKFLLGIF